MRPPVAAALLLAVALPACAQRGGGVGGHAGFSGHSPPAPVHSAPAFHGSYAPASSFHGNYAPSAPIRYSGAPMAHAPVSYPSSMRLIAPGVRYPTTAPIIRPTFYHPPHGITINHAFVIRTYPVYPYAYGAFPYAYPSYVYGYLPPDLVDNSYDNFDNTQPAQPQPDYSNGYPQPQPEDGYPQPVPQPGYGYPQPMPQPEGYASPQPMPAYPQPQPEAYSYPSAPSGYPVYAQPAPASPQMQYVPGSASTVILIYRDGRPPEQIQNYLATRSTLTVLDGGRRREIPLSDLNLPATMSANRQTGVDFQLPTR